MPKKILTPFNASKNKTFVRPSRTIKNFNLDHLFPPVTNTVLPDPSTLANSVPLKGNALTLRAARPGEPEPYAFGYTICDGAVIAAHDRTDFLVLDILWSVGEIKEISFLLMDGERVELSDDDEHFTGTTGQAASTIMTALKGSYDTLTSKAHSVIHMLPGMTLDIRAVVKGLKLYDPRTETTRYSTNPALALARIFVDCGYTMDWDSVEAAADYCEEILPYPDGIPLNEGVEWDTPTDPDEHYRWSINGQIRERQQLAAWIETMRTYANCFVDIIGSTVSLVPDKPRNPNHTVVADDMLEESVRVTTKGGRDVPDTVTVIFQSGTRVLPKTYPPGSPSLGIPADTGRHTTLQLPFYNNYQVAGRKAEESYKKAHNEMSLEFIGFDKYLARTIGDVGTITNADYGISAREMVLVENRRIDRGRSFVRYEDYSDLNYSDAEHTPEGTFSTSLYNPYRPPPGPTPTLSEDLVAAASPQYYRLQIDFTGIEWAYIESYFITITGSDETEFTLDGYEDGFVPVHYASPNVYTVYTNEGMVPGVTYTVNVYIFSIVEALSAEPGTADYTFQDLLIWDTAPLNVTNITPTNAVAPATLQFINEIDFQFEDVTFYWYTGQWYHTNAKQLTLGLWADSGGIVMKYEVVEFYWGSAAPLFNGANVPNVWHQLVTEDELVVEDVLGTTGTQVLVNVTIARDDGTGNPEPGTEVTKPVTFTTYIGEALFGECFVFDEFSGTNGASLAGRTPDEIAPVSPAATWEVPTGTITIFSNAMQADAVPAVGLIESEQSDCSVHMNMRVNSSDFALIGRAQDMDNCWELEVTEADTSSPVLSLREIVAGSATVRASVVMTANDYGHLPSGVTQRPIRLRFEGTTITGTCFIDDYDGIFEISYTSSQWLTETKHGFRLTSTDSSHRVEWFYVDEAELRYFAPV